MSFDKSKVYFVGAGPGDPELITVKGRRALECADVIIYAGSLVNPDLVTGLNAQIYNSASMTLQEIVDLMSTEIAKNKLVVRLHTGDTAFYSAISEQIQRLKDKGIAFEIIPGVSSASAGAGVLGQELTIPEVSQTVIFTRLQGKTPVPQRESLASLAKHQATMVIFLSASLIKEVKKELLQGYPPETPVAVVYKATWAGQKIIRGTLKDLDTLLEDAGIKKTALIYVGEALRASLETLSKESRLYHKDFKHEFRG